MNDSTPIADRGSRIVDWVIVSMRWVFIGGLFALVTVFAAPAFAQGAPGAGAGPTGDTALDGILNLLAPVFADLKGRSGWVEQALLVLACLRVAFKPIMTLLDSKLKGTSEEAKLEEFEHGPIYKTISFILDFGGSIKLPLLTKPKTENQS